jgi:uncharacterized protein (TIGR02145 family)
MKNLFVVFLFYLCGMSAATLNAQPQTVRTTSSAGATSANGHLAVVIGQPFFTQFTTAGDYDFSLGVAQAQWTRDTVYDVITYNTPYTENYFNLPAQTESHKDSVYVVNGGIYNYDLLRTLYLIVCPENLADNLNDNIIYEVLAVSGHCWTKQNLRTPVTGAMTYTSPMGAEVPESYGPLYTWQMALNGTSADADGYVQGICPTSATDSWHLPDATEIHDLMTNPSESLRSVEGWSNAVNNNSTDFTAYPAGLYNASVQRFEGLGTQTDWWMVTGTTVEGLVTPTVETMCTSSLQIPYYCDSPIIVPRNPNDAVSVRCVMKNVWPE